MNLKKFLSLSVVLMLVLFTGLTNAQTFYVNNQTGNDANSGTTVAQAKLTVASAILAAPTGSTISVAVTGIDYTEGDLTITKALTFTSTGVGIPRFVNADLTVNLAGGTTFTGKFQFQDLVLTLGKITGANNLTVEGNVTRTAGSVDGDLSFTAGAHNFLYNGAAAVTSGGELPSNATNIGNLTTAGAGTKLTLSGSKTVNGVLTTSDVLDLGANTLAVKGASVAHVVAGNVINGTMAFEMTGATTVTGNFDLPNVTATSVANQLLTLTTNKKIGNLTASGISSVRADNAVNVGAVINNATYIGPATGKITLFGAGAAAKTVASVTNNNSGSVLLNPLAGTNLTVTGNVLQSGTGYVSVAPIAGAGTVTVGGTVVNNPTLTYTNLTADQTAGSNYGVIRFGDKPVTVTGKVTNSTVFTGTNGVTNSTHADAGEITFANTTTLLTLTGGVEVSSSHSLTKGAGTLSFTNSGDVTFASTSGNVSIPGGIYVSSNWADVTGATITGNGGVTFSARTTGSVGLAGTRVGTVLSQSLSANVSANGDIDFGVAATGTFFGTNVTQDAFAAGGDILFGNHVIDLSGSLLNKRTVAGADIISAAATVAHAQEVDGDIINSGKSKIDINLASASTLVLKGKLENTGTGSIEFSAASGGAIDLEGGINISAGKIEIPATHSVAVNVRKDWVVSGGTLNILGTGVAASVVKVSANFPSSVNWTAGTINFTGKQSVTIGSLNTVIGAATTNPTFTSATTELIFDEPIPNQLQTVQIGGASPVYPGPLSVTNAANIPSPVITFQPIAGLSVANLYVINDVKFDNGSVLNATKLDGVRLNVGKNGVYGPGGLSPAGGNFQNTTGYTTVNGGYVMMSGNTLAAAQTVNGVNPKSGATFGNFGVDNESAIAVTFGANVNKSVFTSEFYLAEGNVNFTDAQFDGPAPYPTVYRTEGLFTTPPTVVTKINIVYYGNDKTTALEVPAAGKLNDLTVSTTNGLENGKGIVKLGAAPQVDGTLTIDANQTLFLNDFDITVTGASAVVNGYLVNKQGAPNDQLVFAGATGTKVTGAGYLPGIVVNDGSVGNEIANTFKGLVQNGFGANGVWGGGDDDFTSFDATINFQTGGAGTASDLTAGFAPLVAPSTTHFNNINVRDANDTFTLNSDVVMGGNFATLNGTVALGDFKLTHQGTAPTMSNTGAITSSATGKLEFVTPGTNMTVTVGAATIAANVDFNLPGGAFNLLAGNDLTINGNVNLFDNAVPAGTVVNIAAATKLTLGGAMVHVDATSSFGGAGTLVLDVVAPNTLLTFDTPSTTVTNLTVADNVALTGANSLAVTGLFLHNDGDFNIGSADLELNGNYTRVLGTYSGNGYLIWNSVGVWNHGPALVINNLRVETNLDIVTTPVANTALTVNDNLVLDNALLTQTKGGTAFLTVGNADGALVTVDGTGNISAVAGQVAPMFVGTTNYKFVGASSAPNTFTWPMAQANNVEVDLALAANTVTVGASKSIAGDVTLKEGILEWDSPSAITLASGATVYRDAGSNFDNNINGDATVGTLTAPLVNLVYSNNVPNSHLEYFLPVVVNNVTLLNNTNVTLTTARTVAGLLTINSTTLLPSTLTVNANTVWTLGQTVPATATVVVNATRTSTWNGGLTVAGTYTNNGTLVLPVGQTIGGTGAFRSATGTFTLNGNAVLNNVTLTGATNFNTSADLKFTGTMTGFGAFANLTFGGALAQMFEIPANDAVVNVTLNKTSNDKVMLSGGNLDVNGTLTLTRGVLEVDPSSLITLSPAFNLAGTITALGYVRNPATVADLAHIIGRVGVWLPAGTTGRAEWPVGSTEDYRPAAITFTAGNATIAPTTIIVNHVDMLPAGEKNFAIDGGKKADDATKTNWIAGKAPYYWSFEATTSLGAAQKMDVELKGTNLNRPLENYRDLRIIRRFDGDVNTNGWFLEGAGDSYSNVMSVNVPAVNDTLLTVRNIGSLGSAIAEKAIFTIGIPSGLPVFTAVPGGAVTTPEMVEYTFDFNAIDQDVNSAAPTYSLVAPPAGAVIDAVTGVFKWKPTYAQGQVAPYNVVVRATKPADATVYADYTFAITVTNVNRAPSFDSTDAVKLANKTIKVGETVALTYVAIDPDGGVPTYTLTSVTPAPATAPTLSAAGAFSFTAGLADVGKDFVVVVTATDADGGTTTTTATIKVVNSLARGDADADGTVLPADAAKILAHVVGNITLTGEALWAADANQDGTVTAYDAYYVLYFFANQSWPLAKMSAAMGSVQFNNLVAQEGGSVLLPINLSNTTGVVSVYAEIILGSNVNYNGLNTRLPEGWMVTSNFADGILKVAMVGVNPLTDGDIANVSLKLNDKESLVDVTANAKLNDDLNVTMSAKVREIPTDFSLSQNYPNPFNPTTSIKYSIPQNAMVTLTIYNMLGQQVKSLVNVEQEAGFYTVQWNGMNDYGVKVASGIYIYRISAGKFSSTIKMNLLK